MPMTPAERQRKYRENLKLNNPEKYNEINRKNLERIKSKYIKVSKLTESQKALRRRNWRRLKKNQKLKCQDINKDEKQTKSRKLYLRNYYNLKKRVKKQASKIEKQKKEIAALKKKVYRQKILLQCQKSVDPKAYDGEEIPEPILLVKTSSDTDDDGSSLQTQNPKSAPFPTIDKRVHTGPQTILHPIKVLSESNTNIKRTKLASEMKKTITESDAPTILSNIRVNYSLDDLTNLLNPKRYNVSSNDLTKHFPEMVSSTSLPNTEGEGKPCSSKSKETDITKLARFKNFFDLSDSDEN